jgi:hypothetical protein
MYSHRILLVALVPTPGDACKCKLLTLKATNRLEATKSWARSPTVTRQKGERQQKEVETRDTVADRRRVAM